MLELASLVMYNQIVKKKCRRHIMSSKNTNEVLKKIEENYEGFSKRQKLLADYIIKNYE